MKKLDSTGKALLYGSSTLKAIRVQVNNDIMRALNNDASIRSEMKRVFQQANRRIQNIRTAGLISPAVTALGDIPDKYTVFGMRGSFTDLKLQYAKAIAFLQQPTSTATGARTYGEYIKSTYNLSDAEYKAAGGALTKAVQSLSDSKLGQAMLQYKDFSGYFESSSSDAASLIERAAVSTVDKINEAISDLVDTTTLEVGGSLKDIEDIFRDFGL